MAAGLTRAGTSLRASVAWVACETYYPQLRDHRCADGFVTDHADEAVVAVYDDTYDESRKEVVLSCSDRDFVERVVAHRVKSQRVELPEDFSTSIEVSSNAIQDTLLMLAIVIGVLKLPKVTLYGVWKGKGG